MHNIVGHVELERGKGKVEINVKIGWHVNVILVMSDKWSYVLC